jgi:hypothetical protein
MNEFQVGEPRVRVVREEIDDFSDGYRMTLPPHSMHVLQWRVR